MLCSICSSGKTRCCVLYRVVERQDAVFYIEWWKDKMLCSICSCGKTRCCVLYVVVERQDAVFYM